MKRSPQKLSIDLFIDKGIFINDRITPNVSPNNLCTHSILSNNSLERIRKTRFTVTKNLGTRNAKETKIFNKIPVGFLTNSQSKLTNSPRRELIPFSL